MERRELTQRDVWLFLLLCAAIFAFFGWVGAAPPATKPSIRLVAKPDAPEVATRWLAELPKLKEKAEAELKERIRMLEKAGSGAETRRLLAEAKAEQKKLRRPAPVIPAPKLEKDPLVGDYVTARENQEVHSVLSPTEAVIRFQKVEMVIRPDERFAQSFHETTSAFVAVNGIDAAKVYDGAKITLPHPIWFTGTKRIGPDTVLVAESIDPAWFYVEQVDKTGKATTRPYKPE